MSHSLDGNEQKDLGFCFPLDLTKLRNERVRLVPFESNFEAFSTQYTQEGIETPALTDYMPHNSFENVDQFKKFYEEVVRQHNGRFWFAIILAACKIRKTTPDGIEQEFEVEEGTMAGVTGLLNADVSNSVVELGFITLFAKFQRTFVATHAHGLMLHYLLDPIPHGLHMRRVQWQAHSSNKPSVKAAQRLGFQLEGVIRWQRVLPEGKIESDSTRTKHIVEGKMPRIDAAGNKLGAGRSSAMLSICWDDWLDGGRDHIDSLMSRQ